MSDLRFKLAENRRAAAEEPTEYKIPRAKLFAWQSAAKTQVLFPGMEAKIGKQQMRELERMVLEMEEIIGVVRSDQGFNGD